MELGLAAAYAKLEAYAARFALVINMIKNVTTDKCSTLPEPVDAESMVAGVTLARWFCHETERVYAIIAESDTEAARRQLVERIAARDGLITPRDLMRSSRQYSTSTEAEAALDDLARTGIGRWEVRGPTAQGGRPTRRLVLVGTGVDNTPSEPEGNGGCVNVNGVSGAENVNVANDLLAEAAAEDTDDWGGI